MPLHQVPVFKGATRPACVWGIPIKPFVAACGVFMLLAFWVAVPLALGLVPALAVMHVIADRDDQAFLQLLLKGRFALAALRGASPWAGVSPLAPAPYARERKGGKRP